MEPNTQVCGVTLLIETSFLLDTVTNLHRLSSLSSPSPIWVPVVSRVLHLALCAGSMYCLYPDHSCFLPLRVSDASFSKSSIDPCRNNSQTIENLSKLTSRIKISPFLSTRPPKLCAGSKGLLPTLPLLSEVLRRTPQNASLHQYTNGSSSANI